MATVTQPEQRSADVTVLRGVSFRAYLRMIAHPDNRHLRMAYHDGTLEIMSPILYEHEGPSIRFHLLVIHVAQAMGLRCLGTGSLTVHRKGDGVTRGVGKEPDQAFYIASLDRFPRQRKLDLGAGDPPPDLWIEVDHRVSSRGRMPTYARLGVPEVWQYRVVAQTLRFWTLVEGRSVATERSLALPVLTVDRVRDAILAGVELADTEFLTFLATWVPAMMAQARDDSRPA